MTRGVVNGWRGAAAGVRTPAAAVVSAIVAAGCQGYAPIALSEAPRAESVQVELTAAAAERLAPTLGANVAALDGRVDAAGGDSVRLAVTEATLRNGQTVPWGGEHVALGTADVARVFRKQRSTVRTVLLGVGIVGAAIATASLVGSGGAEGRGTGGGTTPR